MATLAALRKKAKDMGIPATVIRSAEDAEELQSIIDDHDGGSKKSKSKKSAAKKTTAKKRGRPKGSKNKSRDEDDEDEKPKKRGRPKGSTTKTKKNSTAKSKGSGAKSKPADKKSGSGKAKRSTAKRNSSYEPKGGRNLLEDVDYTEDDGWNARPGSAPDRIIKALRKFRGNRDKAFEHLVGDIWDFVNKKTQAGDKRSRADAEKVLRYRISRTAWDFAMRTGQHEKADNRVEYGTGGTGEGTFKRAKSTKSKTSAKKNSTTKSKTKTTKTKTTTTGKKRGRPVGSKNKSKSKSKSR